MPSAPNYLCFLGFLLFTLTYIMVNLDFLLTYKVINSMNLAQWIVSVHHYRLKDKRKTKNEHDETISVQIYMLDLKASTSFSYGSHLVKCQILVSSPDGK